MLALSVRFTCKDEASAAAHDELVAATVAAIRANEPGTLIYAVHRVDGAPLQRIFYELYTDQAAFEAHEAAPHTRHYLAAREEFLVSTEVDRLTLLTGTGLTGTGTGQGGGSGTGTGAGASGSAGAPSVTITCTSTANGHSGSGPAGPGSSGPGMAGPGPGSPGGPGAGAAG
jgi:quinol monooxygenase YgiN